MDSNKNPPGPRHRPGVELRRRSLLRWTAASLGVAAVGSACKSNRQKDEGKGPAVVGLADRPETPDIRFGMIALTDCSPIVIAHEKGFFNKYGINATIVKGAAGRRHATRSPTATSRHAARNATGVDDGPSRFPQKPMVIRVGT